MSALVSNTRLRSAVLLAVPAAMIVIGATACSQDSTPAPAATGSPTSASGSIPLTAATTQPGGDGGLGAAPTAPAGGAGTGTVPVCTATDLEPSLTEQPQRREGDSRMALVHVTNASGHTCLLFGSPVVTLVNGADEAVPVPTANVEQPGPAISSQLRPGGGAFAGIKWTVCDRNAADCPTGNTIKIGLAKNGRAVAATLDGFPAPETANITMKSLQVGTFQPSQQGVVAW